MRANTARVEVYVGSPVEDGTELKFLSRVRHLLEVAGQPAIILANFHVGPRNRQIDFVVATDDHAVAIEVKGYRLPVEGKANGPWARTEADGSLRPIRGQSPYDQALANRFAISDELGPFLADGLDPRDCISGLLCLYPEPPQGSRIPSSDRKLAIGGWSEFERVIASPCIRPIAIERWRAFANHLGLVSENTKPITDAASLLAEYRVRHLELAEAVGGPFHPPAFDVEQGAAAPDLAALINHGRQPFLVGPSGVGKTRLLAELASAAAREQRVPITIRAREFEGELAPLLRKAVAEGTASSPGALLAAARAQGHDVILYVDALNECPPALLPRLIAVLQAFRLRYDALILMSGQSDVQRPALLDGPRLVLLQPGRDRATGLVEAHLGRRLTNDEAGVLDLVATAQDAAVVAGILSKVGDSDGRYRLYDLFTRNLLPRERQASIHAGLASLGTAIRAELRPLIATTSARRLLRQACPDCDPDLLEAVLTDGRLLSSEGNQTRYRHDLFTDFFAATDVLHRAADDIDLVSETLRPFHAELREFVLGGASRVAQDGLLSSEIVSRLLPGVLRGRAGRDLRQRTLVKCENLLDRVRRHFETLTFALPEPEGEDRPHYLVAAFQGDLGSTVQQMALWQALPIAAEEGLLTQILDFAKSVDGRIASEVARLRIERPDIRVFNQLAYATIHGVWSSRSDLSLIRSLVSGFQNRFGGDANMPQQLADELDRFEEHGPTELLILLAMTRGCWRQMTYLPSRMTELLAHAWESRIYHVRLFAMDMVYLNGHHFAPELKAEVADLLNGYLGDNIMLNTILLDALKSLDAVDFGLDVESVVEEYRWIAAQPIDKNISSSAMSAFSRTWDHPDPDAYWEAFHERLSDEMRSAVLVRALADPEHDAMSLEFAIRELPEPLSKEAVEVVEAYADLPIDPSISVQSSVSLFAAACASLARSGIPLPPPKARDDTSSDERAWQRMAPIIHAMNHDPMPAREEAALLWPAFAGEDSGSIFDVVRRTAVDTPMFGTRAAVNFAKHFPAELRLLAIAVMSPEYRPSCYFLSYRTNIDELLHAHREFALTLLGTVGQPDDLALLREWMDDSELGEVALASARKLETPTARGT